MKSFDIIFVVCTYGAYNDLVNFINSVKKIKYDYKIIVANSFYDEKTKGIMHDIAQKENCDFLSLTNNGYGHSLNEGIKYAIEKYNFKYLAISNADILIENINLSSIPKGKVVIAPQVKTLSGKRQNPFYIFPHFKLFKFSKFYRDILKKENSLIVVIVAKLERIIFNLIYGNKKNCFKKIYAGHGSFILFSKSVLKLLVRPFEDDIFLYCEENFLGYRLNERNIPFYYTNDVCVIHTEDGSQHFYKHKVNNETKKSIEKYHKLIRNK